MKRALLVLSCLFFASQAYAEEIPASSNIVRVTVYQDRAMVTRRAKVELPAGRHQVAFAGLPSSTLEDSLRANAEGSSSALLTGVEMKRDFVPGQTHPRFAQVLSELEKLQEDLKEIQSRQSALAGQRSFIDAVRSFSGSQVPQDIQTRTVPAAELTALSQFILDSYRENGKAGLLIEKEVAEKTKEISAKQQELYSLQSGASQETRTALVNIETKNAATLDIDLSYQIFQCFWTLSYDAKVDPEKGSVDLISFGNVQQSTGEDWKDVDLTLSSAKPALGGRMPELSAWFVDFLEILPFAQETRSVLQKSHAKMAAYSADAVAGSAEMVAAPALMAVPTAQAVVSQDLGSVTYRIEGRSSVLSDNRSYKFPVQQETFKAELDYEATPKLSPYAFLHSKVVNDKDHALPGGDVNVFVNDNYIGRSSLPTVGMTESFDLYLGVDESLKIKRTELVDKKKRSLMGLRTRKDFAYKIEMENYRKKKVSLKIFDQLPVSKNQEIRAELVASSVKPSEVRDLGVHVWSFDLEPGAKKSFEFQFFVEHPSDKTVTGL